MSSTIAAFLEQVAARVLSENASEYLFHLDGDSWETLVAETAEQFNNELGLGYTIVRTAPQAFPDLLINNTGVEIKKTIKDDWRTTGNSVSERRREVGVDDIYFFFGKLGGKPGIKVRRYEECLPKVAVTHNPRYIVDMLLPAGESIFDKMGISYQEFTALEKPLLTLTQFLRSNLRDGEEVWWLGGPAHEDTDQDPDELMSPVLATLERRDPRRETFVQLAMALRPEIFSTTSSAKFERLPLLLLKRFGAVVSNMRDLFTAGGTASHEVDGKRVLLRAIDDRLLRYSTSVEAIIESSSEDDLKYGWNVAVIEDNRLNQYSKLLDMHANGLTYSLGSIFLDRLS